MPLFQFHTLQDWSLQCLLSSPVLISEHVELQIEIVRPVDQYSVDKLDYPPLTESMMMNCYSLILLIVCSVVIIDELLDSQMNMTVC